MEIETNVELKKKKAFNPIVCLILSVVMFLVTLILPVGGLLGSIFIGFTAIRSMKSHKILSIITFIVSILVFLSSLILLFATDDKVNNTKINSADKNAIINNYEDAIYGKWTSQNGTLFVFSNDGKYGYYKDENDISDNYYKGPFEAVNGKEAMDDLGITDEEYNRSYKNITGKKDNIFAIKMYMETLHSEGIDKSDILDKNNYYFFIFLISKDDSNSGIAFNVYEPEPMAVTRSN